MTDIEPVVQCRQGIWNIEGWKNLKTWTEGIEGAIGGKVRKIEQVLDETSWEKQNKRLPNLWPWE